MSLPLVRGVAIAMLLTAASLVAASDSETEVRREFRLAYASTIPIPEQDSAALRGYILYPYLQAIRLQRALNQPGHDTYSLDERIGEFLTQQQGLPVVRELRRAWLLDLAARQQWGAFLAYFSADTNDIELRCWQATAWLASDASVAQFSVLRQSLPKFWLSPARLPTACNAPFDWARNQNLITPALVEQRARLVLQSGNTEFARELATTLPDKQGESIRQWAILIEKPQQAFDALIATPGIVVEDSILQDAWLRFARKDPDAALARYTGLIKSREFSGESASPYAQSLALSLSWSRRSESLVYFARVMASDKTDQSYEWHARAALWAGDWHLVAQVITAMPETLKTQARWRYWLARAQQQIDQPDSARTLYLGLIANDDNYFAAMAAARLGVRYEPHAHPIAVVQSDVQYVDAQSVMQRMRELVQVNLRQYAMTEWNALVSSWPAQQQLAAARLVRDWGWYEQTISVTARLGQYNDYQLLYPSPYTVPVEQAARLSGLTTDLIYGQMRQESLFRPDALSSANAHGLLQLLPATARTTAKQFKLPPPTDADLFNPEINAPLGAAYLKSLVNSFDGQILLALAAYNAGTTAVRRWLPDKPMDADIWMENIPYNETRNYVQRILWHSLVFHWLREREPVDSKAWLAQVIPD